MTHCPNCDTSLEDAERVIWPERGPFAVEWLACPNCDTYVRIVRAKWEKA